jgi:hypothetical protein
MFRTGDPTKPMFRIPSILVWFGLIGQEIRQVHVPRTFAVDDGSLLCWYYCPVAELPQDMVSYFGGSVGLRGGFARFPQFVAFLRCLFDPQKKMAG